MSDHVGHGIDVVVSQRRGLLGGLQLFGTGEGILVPAHGIHQHFHGVALTGAGVADIDALAFEILKGIDVGVLAGKDGERLAMQLEDGAQILVSLAFEVAGTVVGLVLHIGPHPCRVRRT